MFNLRYISERAKRFTQLLSINFRRQISHKYVKVFRMAYRVKFKLKKSLVKNQLEIIVFIRLSNILKSILP